MKIELTKDVNLKGETWFHILVNGLSKYCSMDVILAGNMYDQYVANAQNVSSEVLKSVEL